MSTARVRYLTETAPTGGTYLIGETDLLAEDNSWVRHTKSHLEWLRDGETPTSGRFAHLTTEPLKHRVTFRVYRDGDRTNRDLRPIFDWIGENVESPWRVLIDDDQTNVDAVFEFEKVADAVACKLIFNDG